MRRVPVVSVLLVVCLAAGAPLFAQEPTSRLAPSAVSADDASQAESGISPPPSAHGAKAFLFALGRDFKHLPSVETALTLGIGGGLALAASPADARLTRDAVRTENLEETLDAGAILGGGWVQAGGALGTMILGHLTASGRLQTVGADLVRAQVLSGLLTQGLKHAVNRQRPDGAKYSFPSGHASASFASAAVLERHYGWKVGLFAYGAAAYVATSRLSENRHYASDVIFGSALGLVSGRTVTVERGANRFAVMPIALPGGVGVTVSMTQKP